MLLDIEVGGGSGVSFGKGKVGSSRLLHLAEQRGVLGLVSLEDRLAFAASD